jgi:hypothetical protein
VLPGFNLRVVKDDPRNGESTDEYSAGSESNSEPERDPVTGLPPMTGEGYKRKFWEPLGFDSFNDYLRYMNRMQTLYTPLPRGTRVPTPKGIETPGDPDVRPRPELRRRQVNIKLREAEGEALDRAARIYGLSPATLARVLVNQGVAAILERY